MISCQKTTILKLTVVLLIGGLSIFNPALAEDSSSDDSGKVRLIELEDADCALKGGNLIALVNLDPDRSFEVWVDRWFMGVQTADHTRHLLSPGLMPTPLGCSLTLSGEQHWAIYSVKIAAP
ncbi:MAG: hypothetical protein CVU35_00725 [Betaproteobacteria bacterium HGW-Betaproteobacteria-8]|nr:MAG: hypothetical protein CVU35_00725 [Betaproteobacteria bacterium HGW-Betaproteobacteria-8]